VAARRAQTGQAVAMSIIAAHRSSDLGMTEQAARVEVAMRAIRGGLGQRQ
jgi:hypothetical protein